MKGSAGWVSLNTRIREAIGGICEREKLMGTDGFQNDWSDWLLETSRIGESKRAATTALMDQVLEG